MKTIRIAVAVLALAAVGAFAQDKPCSPADSAKAEKALDNVVNWDLMYKAYKAYSHCDSGLAEDLFTDALMRIAVEWKNVELFASRMQADPEFKAFVHKHMRSLTAKDDVKSVQSRAQSSCPPKLAAFCAELVEVAKSAQ
jgi:hypothetical protein